MEAANNVSAAFRTVSLPNALNPEHLPILPSTL